ncbi:effector-associated domain EAD1-containing protein [Sorangium sp. So ce385]|uniref:effector-associated domain EAD1-containing protein n=1 Tax=Sorangium sp. So ce385 TaxID=3133308 RepID=UPI003F5B1BAE
MAIGNPIFEDTKFRRDLPEARDLEGRLADTFDVPGTARNLAQQAGLDLAALDVSGPPSTFWSRILDNASREQRLEKLIEAVAAQEINQPLQRSIEAVRAVTLKGSLQATRFLLDGDRPFLGRKNLRDLLPELQDWQSAAAILVVRGEPDSGRTETQVLLADRNRDRRVLLDENLPLRSAMRQIWKAAGASGEPPVPGAEPLTTESALLLDFWTDIQDALETNDRKMWVLFDDLDKGPGRVEVRLLAEVLAIRLRSVAFQRRLRLVLLGYPGPQLPEKVQGALIRDDTTEVLDETHVEAFLDYCLTRAGKRFDRGTLASRSADLCQEARAKATKSVPYHETLYGLLTAWHRKEIA